MTPTIYACFSLDPREWKTTNEIATFVTPRRYPGIRDGEFPVFISMKASDMADKVVSKRAGRGSQSRI
jgi:hypothetical protein